MPIQSKYMPWAMMAFRVLTGGELFADLIGVGVGHLYYFLTNVFPESHGYMLLKTPGFIHKLVAKLNEDRGGGAGGPPANNGFPMPGRPRQAQLNNDGAEARPGAAPNNRN